MNMILFGRYGVDKDANNASPNLEDSPDLREFRIQVDGDEIIALAMKQPKEWSTGHLYLAMSKAEEKTVQKAKEEVVLQPVTI